MQMEKMTRRLFCYFARGWPKEKTGRLSLALFGLGGLAVCGNPYSPEHLSPLLKMRFGLVFLGLASACWLSSAVLGFVALHRAKKSKFGEKLGKYWLLAGFHSLFSVVSIIGFTVGAFFYLKFQRLEDHRAEQEAAAVRAKFGEGEGFNAEMARRINRDFQDKLVEVKRKYSLAGASMTNPMVLDMSGVTSVEAVRYRVEIIREFIPVAEELRDFIKDSAAIFEGEADRYLISKALRAEILKGFLDRTTKINPMIVELRDAELRKCREMVKLVEFLEQTWGKWTCDSDSGELTFKDDSQAKDYTKLATRVTDADSRMTELQKKIEAIRQSSE